MSEEASQAAIAAMLADVSMAVSQDTTRALQDFGCEAGSRVVPRWHCGWNITLGECISEDEIYDIIKMFPPSPVESSSSSSSSSSTTTMYSSEAVSIKTESSTLKSEVSPSKRPLAPITRNRIDLEVIKCFAPEMGAELSIIESVDAFEQLYIAPVGEGFRRSSLPRANVQSLCDWDVIEPAEELVHVCRYFQVHKKGDEDRLIVNCSPINAAQKKPDKMRLPRVHEVMELILSFKFGATIDAVSYFYQFPLAEGIRGHFGLAQNQARGRPMTWRPKVKPMGWKFAPRLAQETSWSIVRETLRRMDAKGFGSKDVGMTVWVDNFILLANSFESLMILIETFKQVCREANVQMHPTIIEDGGSTMNCLGMKFDLVASTVQMEPSWMQKFALHLQNPKPTYTEIAALLGKMMWAGHVHDIPLCLMFETVECCRTVARDIQSGRHLWEDKYARSMLPLRMEIAQWWNKLVLPFTLKRKPAPAAWYSSDGYSDPQMAAWAFVCGETARSGRCHMWMSVFFAELLGAVRAIEHAARSPFNSAIIEIDNMGLVYALNNGHSSVRAVDKILALLLSRLPSSFTFSVRHVHSEFNPADEFTRHRLGESCDGDLVHQRAQIQLWG